MKKLIICLLLIGCARAPSEEEIQEAARVLMKFKESCEHVASTLKGGTAHIFKDYSDGMRCEIYFKDRSYYTMNLSREDLFTMERYISAKEKRK